MCSSDLEELQTACRLYYVKFEAASTQFAEETRMALEYVSKSATDRADEVGKEAKKEASETSTAVATVSGTKKKAPVHTVGPGVTSLPVTG